MNAILKHLEAGTLVRNEWGDGYQRACLYSAMFPGATTTENCPSEHMPQWFADLTPLLDDQISIDGWESRMRRYALASDSFHKISTDGWERIRRTFLAGTIRQALYSARPVSETFDCWPKVVKACLNVIAAFEAGRDPNKDEIRAAWAASYAAEAAARAAARAAAWAAADAADAAARAAARAAAWAAADAADAAAGAAAWDEIFDRLLALIEAEAKRQ